MTWREHTETQLRAAGHRSGRGRRAVIGVLARHDCLMTASDILEELDDDRIGFATVYRALETLTEVGAVRRVDAGIGSAAYEPVDPSGHHHHHVVCDSCGDVTAFEDDALERAVEALSGRLGHRIESHEVVLRGACRSCRP